MAALRLPQARGACLALLVVLGCSRDGGGGYTPEYGPRPPFSLTVYAFGVHPLHNPQRLAEVYGPVVDHVNRNLAGAQLRLEASRSYDEFDRKLAGRQLAFALPNPYQTLSSLRSGYRIFGKMGDDQSFRGILLVRRDSGIRDVADLKGEVVAFPAPTALAATMMPLYYLHTHGLDANRDIQRLFAGSQESSIMSVYLKTSAAAATWPPPWEAFRRREPDVAAALEVRWQTEPLVNNGLVARDDVPPEVVARVGELLFALHTHEAGRRMLAEMALTRFEPADESTYLPVKEFMDTYAGAVR